MNLKLTGVQKMINQLAKVENEISAEVDAELQSSLNKMTKDAKRAAPANFGQLRNSIGSRNESKLRYSLFASAWYAPYVEFGTRGKVKVPTELEGVAKNTQGRPSRGNFKAFVESIYLWGRHKRIIKKGDKNHAVNIARKIYINGIAPQPYLWPAFVAERSKLVSNIRAVVNRKR
jgi:HK97 gp10 family phage protein